MSPSSARLPYLLLLVLSLTVPYAVTEHTYPIPTFYSELSAYVLFILLAAALGWGAFCRRRAPDAAPLQAPRIAGLPLVLALWLLLQVALLPLHQPIINLLGAGFLLSAVLASMAGFWARQLGWTSLTLRVGAYALALGGVAAVLCQLVQLSGQESHFSPLVLSYGAKVARRLYGNMAQANHLATYLSFAMAAVLYLVQLRRMPLAAWLVLSALFAVGEALTVSRTPLVQTAVLVAFGWTMAWAGRHDAQAPPRSLRPWLVPLLLAALYIAVNVLVRWANVKFNLQLADSAAARFEDAGQISPRLSLWRYGLGMFRSHVFTGVGWGEFPYNQYRLAAQLGQVEVANNSHDIIIDLLAKTGLIGTGLFVFGLLAWLWRVLRGTLLTRECAFALSLVAVLGVHALIEYPQQYTFFLLPLAFILGLLEPRAARLPVNAGVAAYTALIVAGLIAIVPLWRDYRRAEVLYYGKAPETEYRAAPALIFSPWGQYGLATVLAMDDANLPYKLTMHEQALSLLPGDTVLKRYAVLLALAGREPAALDVVVRLRAFALGDHTWPDDLRDLLRMCDEQGGALKHFKSQLIAAYGEPAGTPAATSDDDDDGSD